MRKLRYNQETIISEYVRVSELRHLDASRSIVHVVDFGAFVKSVSGNIGSTRQQV